MQSCQPDFSVREDHGADHLECHQMECAGQAEDQAQPAWASERQILLDQPGLLL